jgi:hypothetical protein
MVGIKVKPLDSLGKGIVPGGKATEGTNGVLV